MARAHDNEPHVGTRATIAKMLGHLEELERQAVAPKPQRRRRRRSS